jgi:hypothetical protein
MHFDLPSQAVTKHAPCRSRPAHRDIFAGQTLVMSDSLEQAIVSLRARRPSTAEAQRSELHYRRRNSAAMGSQTHCATVIAGSEWYWAMCPDAIRIKDAIKDKQSGKVVEPPVYWWPPVEVRDFAEGGTLVVVIESTASRGVVSTVHWPWQNILAGEAQFAQILNIVHGNIAEPGFDAQQRPPPLAVGAPQPQPRPLPDSFSLPAEQPPRFIVNVVLQRTFFSTEALHDPARDVSGGCGRPIACVHLSNSLVQYTMTTGALIGNLCNYVTPALCYKAFTNVLPACLSVHSVCSRNTTLIASHYA